MSNPNSPLFQKSAAEAPRCLQKPVRQVRGQGEQEQAEQEHDEHDAGGAEGASQDGRLEEVLGLTQGAVGLQAVPLEPNILEGA